MGKKPCSYNWSRLKLLSSSQTQDPLLLQGCTPISVPRSTNFQAHPQYRLCIIKNVKPQAYTEISSGWLPKKPVSSSGNPGWPPKKAKSEKPGWPPKQAISENPGWPPKQANSENPGWPPNKPKVKTQVGPPKKP